MTWSPPKNVEETEKFFKEGQERIKNGKIIRWGIFYKNEFIGIIGLEDIRKQERKWRHDTAEMGYWLNPEHHNQGFMSEAVKVILEFGFHKYKLNSITIAHISNNKASEKVIMKAGFRYIGEQKDFCYFDNQWWNHKIYEMIKTDYNKKD